MFSAGRERVHWERMGYAIVTELNYDPNTLLSISFLLLKANYDETFRTLKFLLTLIQNFLHSRQKLALC